MSSNNEFPWDIGVYDAHCHPTDTMASIASIPHMKARALTVMGTRGEDQELVQQTAQSLNAQNPLQEDRIIPCFGWHPWFSHQILIDNTQGTDSASQDAQPQPQPQTQTETDIDAKKKHYTAVLAPSVVEDEEFLNFLSTPIPISQLIADTKKRLESHPYALVGEIGLDKSFRLPGAWTVKELGSRDEQLTPGSREGRPLSPYKVKLEHQKALLKCQLQLAGEMQRAVSVHSVQAHGAVFDVLKELWAGHEKVTLSRRQRERRQDAEGALSEDSEHEQEASLKDLKPLQFPPRICMHSYSGPVEPIRQYMNKKNPSDVYFSFSAVINFTGAGLRKVCDVIKMLPEDRILIESDLHTAGTQMDELLEEAARQVCEIRGWELRKGVQQLADNWKRFIFG
ncbi:hypothetical protein N7478_004284 [Penicillium angulare]|uniref:uncharacterized protein n=1 Tax=Penicillium angulare TaxID=116970 RepID=UPI00253FD395|nr:uncharacterized protein N7478_004284 [Penicillium angulare]KAJ5278912.1 hypothetical protein N7478_004284 [Penicillium angulare]